MKVRARGAQATIFPDRISHNLAVFKTLHPGPLIAVVKADAYGHGLDHVVPALKAVDALAVATIDEAMQLRGLSPDQRIILLEGVFNAHELNLAIAHRFDVVVHQMYQMALLDELPETATLRVWLKVDTGMGRLGFRPDVAEQHIQTLIKNPQVDLHLMSHFAQSDQPKAEQTLVQLDWNQKLKTFGLPFSFSNTGAVLNGISDPNEWARVGIGLLGISPLPDDQAQDHGLKNAMQLQSKVIATKTIEAGDAVGYGAHYVADKSLRLGIVGIGYADGYPWSTQAGSQVLVNGQACSILGRVSMDMLAIDLSALPDTEPGQDVVLWGDGLPAEVVAQALGVIPYTLVCGITKRVKFHVAKKD